MTSHSSAYKTARWFVERGYSVIPVRKSNKKAYPAWTEYQSRLPTHEELKKWWYDWPDANVALITGKLSGVNVIDIDTKEGQKAVEEFIPDNFISPTSKTPKGGRHYFFKYKHGLRNKSKVLDGVDIRTDGGYAIVPPSINSNGKTYEWFKGLKINEVELPEMPEFLFDVLKQACDADSRFSNNAVNKKGINVVSSSKFAHSDKTNGNKLQQTTTNDNISFEEGERDESLFHAANCLIKGGMNEANARNCLHILAANCSPPFDKAEANLKIKSAILRAKKRDIGLTQEIKDFVMTTNDNISTTFVYNTLDLTTKDNKKKAVVVLGRLCEDGILERVGRGEFRRVEKDLEFLDLTSAKIEEENIWLPLGLKDMARIYPGNIIVVAGSPNAGKTAFLLSCCRYNMRNYRVRYLSSEMGIEEAADRINEFDDITLKEWQKHWEFAERYDNFQDSLLKGRGNINIIDYLEQPEGEAYKASFQLGQIHRNLDGAIAIVALQKNRGQGRDTGVGGDQTLAKPRLYLAMDYGWMKIVKCKSFKKEFGNPNWMECEFRLGSGHHFKMDKDWGRND